MEDYSIEDYQIFGSTAYDGDYVSYGSQNARLHSSFGYRAEPSADTARDIIVITLNEEMVITGIATQGYGGPGVLEWVTGFYLLNTSFEGIRLPVINANGQEMVRYKRNWLAFTLIYHYHHRCYFNMLGELPC